MISRGALATSAIAALVSIAASGCGGMQSALAPMTPQAREIDSLFWSFFWVLAATFGIVVGATTFAALRGHRRARAMPDAPPSPKDDDATHRRLAGWVGTAIGITAIVLFTLLVETELSSRALSDAQIRSDALEIEVVGHQWWWEITYRDPHPSRRLVTANELVVPVGRQIVLHLESRDVIHSFWMPNLQGKLDLIPGYQRRLVLQLDRPGTYRGQCAEFCGHQHAHMGIALHAVAPDEFEAWRRGQLQPGHEPASELERRGRDLFVSSSCGLCHSVEGTSAAATIGPDLTHLASRHTLAAGAVPNTPGNLAGWILDPQSIKPGASMPPNRLSGEELQALLAYLRSLR